MNQYMGLAPCASKLLWIPRIVFFSTAHSAEIKDKNETKCWIGTNKQTNSSHFPFAGWETRVVFSAGYGTFFAGGCNPLPTK